MIAIVHDEIDARSSQKQDEEVKIPWHFWIVVSLGGIYLAYRFIQIIILLITTIV